MSDGSTQDSGISSKLSRMREAYRERLATELSDIRALAESTIGDGADEGIPSLHQRLHKLAGSAGTFGFHELGTQARALEQQLKQWLDSPSALRQSSELESLVSRIRQFQEAFSDSESSEQNIGIETKARSAAERAHVIGLIERDPMLRDYIAQQLQSFGFVVEGALDAGSLKATGVSTDLLLVDHRAAEAGNHPDAAQYWREQLSAMDCPFIMMGGHEDFHVRLEAVRAGAESYFHKPIDVPRVASRITRSIQNREQAGERILLVDDDQALCEHLDAVLSDAGMVVSTLSDPTQLLHRAAEHQPELVLMDLHMPKVSGDELAAMLRQFDKWSNLPILYLSREESQAQRAEALRRGGDDFIDKPVSNDYLIKTCRNRVRRLRTMQQAIAQDGLTGLLKHASIKEALETEIRSAERSGNTLSVVMLDIDHFKSVNDSFGHALGDVVISTMGTLLRQHFRASDRLGRYGGEEFVAVLPNCTLEKAEQLVESLRLDFAAISFVGPSQSFSCTLSAGIADNRQKLPQRAEDLLERADQALYQSKSAGRNRITLQAGGG